MVMCVMSCGSARGDLIVMNDPALPWGHAYAEYSGEPGVGDHDDQVGPIDSFPVSAWVSPPEGACWISAEVDLWYARASVNGLPEGMTAWTTANGLAYFQVENGQLSLGWDPQFDYYYGVGFRVVVAEWPSGSTVWETSYDSAGDPSAPAAGTATLSLLPDTTYSLDWSLWQDTACSIAEARLDLNVAEGVQPVPVPGAALLGVLGLSVAGWRLRRKTA